MKPSNVCLHKSEIPLLLSGDLPPDEAATAESHIAECESCRSVIESMIADSCWWDDARHSLAASATRSHHQAEVMHDAEPTSTEQILDLLGPTDDPNMLGRIGPYEIIGLLGQGGMGAVFKGFDRSLNRFVAIKMLLPHLAASGAARKRFAREGQAVAAVVDDHVMAIHCVDEWQGVPYLVMTYSRGVSLQKRLSDNGSLEVREILRIGMQAAKGLAAAHAQGIVHRDIKPANIFLDQNVERVQLMDFGLARAVDDASLTRSGTLAGTPQYMSPEQARAETVDHRSDLFSLGSVMYAMCTGHAPFRAESSYSVLRLITDKEPRPIREINPNIPEWLCSIISKLMAKQANDRFTSAQEVAELLEDCLAHVQQPTSSPLPASLVPHAAIVRRSVSNVTRKGVITMLGTLGISLLGMMIWQATDPPDISGQWTSEEWGTVVLKAKEPGQYEGTFNGSEKVRPANDGGNNTSNKVPVEGASGTSTPQSAVEAIPPGKLHLKWSAIERRFNGNWGTGDDTKGKISLRLVDNEIRGACTSTNDSRKGSTSPQLTDLLWRRSGITSTAFIAAAEKEYHQLELAEEDLRAAYGNAIDNAKSDEDRERAEKQFDARDAYTPKYLAFEEKYRGTPAGLKALINVVGFARSTIDSKSAAPVGRVEAVDRLIDHYVTFDGIEQAFDHLRGGLPVPREKELLKAVVEKNPSRHAQAESLIAQLELIRVTLSRHANMEALRERVLHPEEYYPDLWRENEKAVLRELESTNPDQLRAEMKGMIEHLREYNVVPVAKYGMAGKAAKHLSHSINKVVIGKPAAEIKAITSAGKQFQLSKLRGSTVLLVFGLNHSSDNDVMYAPLRKLADDYKSRHVEVVMILETDEDKFQSAAALKRHFPWTVIQEPSAGSLSLDWGVRGYPTVFVIDAKGILQSWTVGLPCYDDDSGYDATEVAAELDKLLASKQSHNNDGSKGRTGTDVAKPLYADIQGDWIIESFYSDEDANSRELQKQARSSVFFGAIKVEANELYFRNPPAAGMTRTSGAISIKPAEGDDPRLFQVVDSRMPGEDIRFGMYKVAEDKLTILLTRDASPTVLAPTEGEFYFECHRPISEEDKALLDVIEKNPDEIKVIDRKSKDAEQHDDAKEDAKSMDMASRPLLDAVAELNRKLEIEHPKHGQPPLTDEEVIAAISWALMDPAENRITEFQTDLETIVRKRLLPQHLTITGGPALWRVDDHVIQGWSVQIVRRVTQESKRPAMFSVRKRYLQPPKELLKPGSKPATDGDVPLQDAISAFNRYERKVLGQPQPPLTIEEVIAAIMNWKNRRDENGVDDSTFRTLQEIARTHTLPRNAILEQQSAFLPGDGVRYHRWTVGIRLNKAGAQTTTTFDVRDQFVRAEFQDERDVQWGPVGQNGLQAGVRFNPSQTTYVVGQPIKLEFFFRTVDGRSLEGSLPNVFDFDGVEARDMKGETLPVLHTPSEVVGGWMSVHFSDKPVFRTYEKLTIVAETDVELKNAENLASAISSDSSVVRAHPGTDCRVRFTVPNFANGADGTLQTGEVAFRVNEALKVSNPTN